MHKERSLTNVAEVGRITRAEVFPHEGNEF